MEHHPGFIKVSGAGSIADSKDENPMLDLNDDTPNIVREETISKESTPAARTRADYFKSRTVSLPPMPKAP